MRLSLRARQVTVVTTLAVVSIVVLAGIYLSSLVRLGLEENRARGELLARAIFHRARIVVGETDDPERALREDPGIRAILESSIAYTESVTYTAIVDARGRAIAHSSPTLEGTTQPARPSLGSLLEQGAIGQLRGVYRDSTLETVEPLLLGQTPFGSIRVGSSTILIRNELGRVLRPAAIAVLATLAAAIGLSLLLAQWALRPIHVIKAGLTQLGQGRSGVRLALPASSDFSGLGESFDAISLRLAQAETVEAAPGATRQLADLGHLLRGVAHEVKNPLNAMTIHLELIRQKLAIERQTLHATPAGGSVLGLNPAGVAAATTQPAVTTTAAETTTRRDALQHVTVLGNEVRRLDDVIQGFLRFIKPDELVQEELDMASLVTEVVALVKPEAERNGVSLEQRQPSTPPMVTGDRAMLHQALLNLIMNALQAMVGGGHLRLRVATLPRSVQVEIEDNGSGMSPEVLERAFDLYYTTRHDGSGIGLSMVFRIMQLHGGTIDMESTAGTGTRVRLTLPRAHAPARSAVPKAS